MEQNNVSRDCANSHIEQFKITGSGPWITRLVRTLGLPAVVLYLRTKDVFSILQGQGQATASWKC